MSTRPTERARSSTNGTSAPDHNFDSDSKISKLVQTFNCQTLASLLTILGKRHPDAENLITEMACLCAAKKPCNVVEFKSNIMTVWKNVYYRYTVDVEVQLSTMRTRVLRVLDSIFQIQRACHEVTSCETRLDGLQVLLKIGKIICLSCKESVTVEVLEKALKRDTVFEDTIFDIVLSLTVGGSSSAMTIGQKEALRDRSVGGLMYEMVDVNGIGAEIGVFESLRSSIKLLEGTLPREEAVVIDLEDEVVLDVEEEAR